MNAVDPPHTPHLMTSKAPESLALAAAAAISALSEKGQTVATAESLTGGLVCSTLVAVPGASVAVRGAVVAYATELKSMLLGVDADLLSAKGPVDPEVAAQMALGVRERLQADWGLATTGVAGPDSQGGFPPGRVYIAVAGPIAQPVPDLQISLFGGPFEEGVAGSAWVRRLDLPGDRSAIRTGTVEAVLNLLQIALVGSVSG
jgi:nicotinamide-nucleotide amidase